MPNGSTDYNWSLFDGELDVPRHEIMAVKVSDDFLNCPP